MLLLLLILLQNCFVAGDGAIIYVVVADGDGYVNVAVANVVILILGLHGGPGLCSRRGPEISRFGRES